jgi:hypothetical protein
MKPPSAPTRSRRNSRPLIPPRGHKHALCFLRVSGLPTANTRRESLARPSGRPARIEKRARKTNPRPNNLDGYPPRRALLRPLSPPRVLSPKCFIHILSLYRVISASAGTAASVIESTVFVHKGWSVHPDRRPSLPRSRDRAAPPPQRGARLIIRRFSSIRLSACTAISLAGLPMPPNGLSASQFLRI